MGKLDRAFIKAFGKTHGATPEVCAEPPRTPQESGRSDAAPSEVDSRPRGVPRAASPATARRILRFNLPDSVVALQRCARDQFMMLSDIVRRAQQQAGLKTLLFTSCYRGEGRTSLVLTLARTLAAVSKAKTLLVDGDLLNPRIAKELHIDVSVGLDDVVQQGRPLHEALVYSEGDAFAVLPLRNAVSDPREFIRSDELEQALVALKEHFDLVLIDASPVFSSLDPTVLHRQVDAAVLIVNRELTEDQSVARARNVLESAGLTVLGVAETFA